MQSWIPVKATDPDSQHEITRLRQQVAQLRQRVGDTQSEADPPTSSTPSGPSTPVPPIKPSLQGANAPPAPPAFEPQYLLTIPGNNSWLTTHLPGSLTQRTATAWINKLNLPPAQKATVQTSPEKAETWWSQQPASAVDTIQKVAIMMGIPFNLLQKNFDATQLIRVLTLAISMGN